MDFILAHYNHWICVLLMAVGFYGVINSTNLFKKLISLSIFQTSVLLLYISGSFVTGGWFPILNQTKSFYINPLPHVLMLTAIVVGIATIAVGLAIAVRIKEAYGTIEEDELLEIDMETTGNQMQDAEEIIQTPPAKRRRGRPRKSEKSS